MTILALALLVLALALAAIGLAGAIERLPRSRWLGLRVESLHKDDEAWRIGHRAAGRMLIAAAGPPLLLAIGLMASPPDEMADWFLIYAVVGVITGGLVALAARGADRAVSGPDTEE